MGSGPAGATAQVGVVTGSVFDSISGEPLGDAAVFLWETPFQAVSDADGRFRFEDVPAGRYNILFFHTRLGEMGISPGPRPIVVAPGTGLADVRLATPSMATIIRSECLMVDRPERSGIVAGRVRDAESDLPLGGSTVTLSWDRRTAPGQEVLSLSSGPGGWFHTCNAPSNEPLLAWAEFFDRQSLRGEVSVAPGGFAEVHLYLGSQHTSRVQGRLVDAETGKSVEGAEVWLRGSGMTTLTDDGGRFRLGDVQPGTYMLLANHLVYGPKMDTLEVPSGENLTVEMRIDTRPIAMAPITVTVATRQPISAGMAGGIVLTREDIDRVRQNSRDASDVIRSLHVPGVLVRYGSDGRTCVGYSTGQVRLMHTGCVDMIIYINDVRATDPELALRLPPDAIERMVIFKPVEAGPLFGLGSGNGVWMIYTRGN